MRRTAQRVGLLLLGLGLIAFTGLNSAFGGGAQAQGGTEPLTVMLEWFANPDHAPLYLAQANGYFARRGLSVEIREPGDPSQVPFLVASGAVDLGLSSMFNFIILKSAQGLDAIAVGALLMKPLGALVAIKERGIERLEDLKGGTIGYAVEPVEPAVYGTMLRAVGLEPGQDVQLVKLDFLSLMPALLAGRVDAIGAFRNFEPVKVELAGFTPVVFNQEDYGAPESYQLVFLARPRLVEERPEALRAFLSAIADATLFLLAHPERAKARFFEALPHLRDELNLRAYDRTVPIFVGAPCHNDPDRWTQAQRFLLEEGIIPQTLPLDELFTEELLPGGCRG